MHNLWTSIVMGRIATYHRFDVGVHRNDFMQGHVMKKKTTAKKTATKAKPAKAKGKR